METINHECYVSPEVAKLLKEAGFDWRCRKCYNNGVLFDMEPDEIRAQIPQHSSYDVPAPTLEVAQRWLREVKGISAESGFLKPGEWGSYVLLNINKDTYEERTLWDREFNHETYEEALETSIKKALEIILEKGE